MRARVAWGLAGLIVVAVALDTVFTAAHRSLLSESAWAEHHWPLVPLAGAGCAVMGALVVSRHPRQPLGWLLCAASLISVTLAGEAYSGWVLEGDGPGTPYWAHVAAWASSLLGWPAFTAVVLIFLGAPDGRLLSPRWRWAVVVLLTGLGLHTLGTLTIDPGAFRYGEESGDRAVSGPLLRSGVLLVAVGLVASAVSLGLRLRRARDDERRQLLWIASSAALLALGVLVVLVVPWIQGDGTTWLAALPLGAAYVAFPLCVAVAVLRHRLLDIDVIVNRAVLLAAATALTGAGYVLVVVLAGRLGGGGFWPSLLATAAAAMAFQPLRRLVVRAADRLAYGAAAAPYEALAELGRRLGESPDPAALLPIVADAAGNAVGTRRTTVRLVVDGAADLASSWPAADGPEAVADAGIPVVHGAQTLGLITVQMPAGRSLRRRDLDLLRDLAEQAGVAFRNARLSAELAARVDQLDGRTHALGESRRRLISAGDAERSRLERSIAEQVVPHLSPLPALLRQLTADPPGPAGASRLGPMIASSNAALEALREITRSVFPAQLARSGLPAAIASSLARDRDPGRLTVEPSAAGRRLPDRVEAAAYYCVAEAARTLAAPLDVRLAVDAGRLRAVVSGGARGVLPLDHMADRVEAAGGSVSTTTHRGRVVVEVLLPVAGQPPAADQAAASRAGPNADLVTYAAAPDAATKASPSSSS